MSLLTERLSRRIEAGSSRRVKHPSRVKVYSDGGILQQVFSAEHLVHTYDLRPGIQSESDYYAVQNAFYVVMGTPYDGMLFRDPLDHTATATNSVCYLLSGSTYQLGRRYRFGSTYVNRRITRPFNSGSLAVFDAGGTPLTPTVDYTDGTFTVVSGTPAYWTGIFDVPVTFVDDEWTANYEPSTSGGFIVSGSVLLEEIIEVSE
jgi:uncharacterized protein (TIGR02217 family)